MRLGDWGENTKGDKYADERWKMQTESQQYSKHKDAYMRICLPQIAFEANFHVFKDGFRWSTLLE